MASVERVARHPALIAGSAATLVLGTLAAWVAHKANRAERTHRPHGEFVTVDDVRLHYLDIGSGSPVVLLHGNAVHAMDFTASGLLSRLARKHRVIAFDRPGFGHSARPRDRLWTAAAQAALVRQALDRLGIVNPAVLGHSWGTLVALEMALQPDADVRKLALVSGYYFPTARADALLAAPQAIPLLGDLVRYTLSPLIARATLDRTVKTMFAPRAVPVDYVSTLSREMLVRPSQLRANSEDALFMVPSAARLRDRYRALNLPTTIFAGDADRVVDPVAHSFRLHRELPGSELHLLPGVGHMAHHGAADTIADAIA